MLSFFILTAAAAATSRTFPPAEKYDFLGIRVWQEQDHIFTTSPHDQEVKAAIELYLNNLESLWHSELSLGDTGNIALIIIDDGVRVHFIPRLFLSIGSFFSDFVDKETSNVKDHNSIDIKLLYTSVYTNEINIEDYIESLEAILNQENTTDLLGFRKIFLSEIQDDTNIHFPQNWHHSEQGILQWMLNSEGQSFLQSISGQPKYRIFILTYRDMCLRCSTTFFLAKDLLATALATTAAPSATTTASTAAPSATKPTIEIISMSIERYEDHLNAQQNLVLTDQNEYLYNSIDETFIIRGMIENPSPEGRERIIKEMNMDMDVNIDTKKKQRIKRRRGK